MVPAEIVCARCAWRNEPTARMCGGCGAPLRTPDSGAANGYQPGLVGVSGAGASAYYAPDAPTTMTPTPPDLPGLGAPGQPYVAGAVGGWPGAAAPVATETKPRADRKRVAIICGAVLAALIIGLLSAWFVIIQPALHRTVDTQLRNALTSVVSDVPSNLPGAQYKVTIGEVNSTLSQLLPADAPIKNLQAHTSGSEIVFTYSFFGGSGSVITQPYVSEGHLQVEGTKVNGWLSLVESGDQTQSALNDALNTLPQKGKIAAFTVSGDAIMVTIAG